MRPKNELRLDSNQAERLAEILSERETGVDGEALTLSQFQGDGFLVSLASGGEARMWTISASGLAHVWEEKNEEEDRLPRGLNLSGATYPYVRLWGSVMASLDEYVDRMVDRAVETVAPEDAIYEITRAGGERTGEWATFSELPARHRVRAIAEAHGLDGALGIS